MANEENKHPTTYTLKGLNPVFFEDLKHVKKMFGFNVRQIIIAAIEEKVPKILKSGQLREKSGQRPKIYG